MRAVGELDDDEGIPQVNECPRGLAAQPAKQDRDQQAGDQIEDHGRDLKGRHRLGREANDDSEEDLRNRQVRRSHLRVVDQGAVGRGEVVEGGRVHAMSVRVHAGVLHVAIPKVTIDIIGERGRRGEEREAEEDGEEEDEGRGAGERRRKGENEESGEVEGEGCEVAREVVEERRAAQRR